MICQSMSRRVRSRFSSCQPRGVTRMVASSSSSLSFPPSFSSFTSQNWQHGAASFDKRMLSSSSSSSSSITLENPNARVHTRGDLPYGSREYLLLPNHISVDMLPKDINDDDESNNIVLASLWAHRNTLFGAKVQNKNDDPTASSPMEQMATQWQQLGTPLVNAALVHAASQGEQPQAVATLYGLCPWVVQQTTAAVPTSRQDEDDASTSSITALIHKLQEDDQLGWEAAWAIATQEPRPGHSVVGQGTYRDGAAVWEQLAKAYVTQQATTTTSSLSPTYYSPECQLYLSAGAELVGIELLADTRPDYLKSAGGAMARFFFV